jgi:hypothetical protein
MWAMGAALAACCATLVMIGCQSSPEGQGRSRSWITRGASPEEQNAHSAGIVSSVAGDAADPNCPPSYEDRLTGGKVFDMYCAACHNARALGERPFASYQNAATHMRVRANLTGDEYRKLMDFLRYWHDIPPATPTPEPSPKRFIFSQPISELRPQPPAQQDDAAKNNVLPPQSPLEPEKE